mmetsp:Transcript_9055/g.13613  ORF Transcript_9055/g.13613 Transcript_9055/m.13613 type:complete len:564 (+) Transcript_9055:70-1761(+)|eukprot:CAMPEP_0185028328 /NCGR_PEP_ID=MMETSP1103-20130426/13965_1 /TAXON_ID=36769 /ORGANISM="Paraphysomonas bandaiensis, Strain Caron Lab Isolate" /LENGTH=563 /DNA_ID=CAMNT_0027562711 /DNA_START=18 /DNA_END=1712 /DNA_ORIENTATION=-
MLSCLRKANTGSRMSLCMRAMSSNIVKSPYDAPELNTNIVNKPLPHFVMQNFLEKDIQDRVALVDGSSGDSRTYRQLYSETHKFAHCLMDMGVKTNDCVGIMSPNHIHYFTTFQGIALMGATSTPINPLYTEAEIEFQLKTTSAKMVIAHPMCIDKVKSVAKKLNIPVLTLGNGDNEAKSVDELIAAQEKTEAVNVEVNPDSTATVPFSSGTTGVPKGVVLSHRNLVSNILQLMPQEGRYFGKDGVLMVPLPFFHIFGMVVGLLVSTHLNVKTVFLPAFDLEKFLQLVQDHKVTRAYVVPPIILALAKHPLVDKYDLSSLKAILSGAAPLGGDVQEACATRLNCVVKQAWGMTELSPAGSCTADDEVTSPSACKGKSGRLVPATEGLIIDPMTGEELPPTEEGELLLRGPQVMQGYLNNEEATKATIRDDGFMHTGDIAKFDNDGWLYITDRCKELIKYKGFQVAPAELEAILNTMPVVRDCVVIPVLDDEAGEIPRAYVALQPTAEGVTEDNILDFVHEKVAPHKRLRGGVVFVQDVPRSASGKLLRRVQIAMDREKNQAKN